MLCMDITSAIQQKVDNVILLPKAIEPHPSARSKPLNHLKCVYVCVSGAEWWVDILGKQTGGQGWGWTAGRGRGVLRALEVCKQPNK